MISINSRVLKFSLLSTIVAVAASAAATPITYVVSGNASGILDGTSFTNQDFTITALSDTSTISGSSVLTAANYSVEVQVATVGSDMITDSIITVSNSFQNDGGFGDTSENLFLAGVYSPVFSTYDLSTSIGPITGAFAGNPGASFGTANGSFELDTINSVSFQATVNAVPEPYSMAVLGLGVGALLLRRKSS